MKPRSCRSDWHYVSAWTAIFIGLMAGLTAFSETENVSGEPPKFVVISNQYDKPEFARLYLCETCDIAGVVTNVVTLDGDKEQVLSKYVKEVITIPEIRYDLTQPFQFDAARKALGELTAAVDAYPNLRAKLLPLGQELKTIADAGANGYQRKNGQWAKPDAAGMQAAGLVIREVSGKEYRNAEITGKEPDGLMVKHDDGVSKVLFLNLPKELQDEHGFDPIAAEAYRKSLMASKTPAMGLGANDAVPQQPSSGWNPESIDDVASCSLIIKTSFEGETLGAGTGFIVKEQGGTFVYTNAHVLEGADAFTMVTSEGEEIGPVTSMEIAGAPFGYFEDPFGGVSGGDAIRMRLANPRDRALTINYRAPVNEGTKVAITGNTKGEGVITRLEGEVTKVTDRALHYDVETHGGNSGSPVVDLESFQVVGIHTWGLSRVLDQLLDYIWDGDGGDAEDRPQFRFGARFRSDCEWQPTSLAELVSQEARNEELKSRIRLLCLLDLAEPSSDGIFPRYEENLRGSYTVRAILEENASNPVLARLIRLDRSLKGSDDGIRVSNVDLMKLYHEGMVDTLQLIGQERANLGDSRRPYYYVMDLRQSRIAEICLIYEKKLAEVCAWYGQKLRVGGKITLAGRPRLPDLNVDVVDLLQDSLNSD